MLKTLKKQKRKGFSMVELVVVLAILGILAAIAIPMYGRYIEKGDTTTATTTANAINNSVIRVLFEKNGEPIFAINDGTPEYLEIVELSNLNENERLEFTYYNAGTTLPPSDFVQKENTWIVCLPQNPDDNKFDFESDIYIYTPSNYDLMLFKNGVVQ